MGISDKELLQVRNSIFLNAVPYLMKSGFKQSPFKTHLYGRNNLGDYSYDFARISNYYLELLTIHISTGDRWIKIFLNIFNPRPHINSLSELKDYDGLKYRLSPNNSSRMRLETDLLQQSSPLSKILHRNELKLYRTISCRGRIKERIRLERNLIFTFNHIDEYVNIWLTIHTPKITDWDGNIIAP